MTVLDIKQLTDLVLLQGACLESCFKVIKSQHERLEALEAKP